MPRSDFSSSCGSEKLYGNTLIDPPNGLPRCGEFVILITSCRSVNRRWAMYLPEKPKAPVTAIRTLAFRQTEKITHSAAIGTLPTDGCSLRTTCACGPVGVSQREMMRRVAWTGVQAADAINPPGFLRARRKRPRSHAAEQRDQLAALHVWMAPAWQEIIWRAAQRSLAVMCPACWCSPAGLLALMGCANRVLIIRTGSMSR